MATLFDDQAKPQRAEPEDIDAQIDAIQARWARQAEAAQRAQDDKEIARMERLRAELLAGKWKPACGGCRYCCRAVLELRQDRCEKYGKRMYYMGVPV
jgi:hypothetical protein